MTGRIGSKDITMQWTKPDFQEITLGGELTAYVNTDDIVHPSGDRSAPIESSAASDSRRDTTA